ncbi:hypothetical protein [Pannonibacter sp. P2PFMT1]|uniref:hypothetical protein n=1 Tax=Pannonibacter sp. P2PFMT1 TaxID=2003582 RepID=UPI00164509DD|nr:hypothetical protein [Pannonibacter sp. P2PFMT1]
MTTVTLSKLHSGFANISDCWTLQHHHQVAENGDYSAEFALPEGLRVGENIVGSAAIYDQANNHYDVSIADDGAPVLIGPDQQVRLSPAAC